MWVRILEWQVNNLKVEVTLHQNIFLHIFLLPQNFYLDEFENLMDELLFRLNALSNSLHYSLAEKPHYQLAHGYYYNQEVTWIDWCLLLTVRFWDLHWYWFKFLMVNFNHCSALRLYKIIRLVQRSICPIMLILHSEECWTHVLGKSNNYRKLGNRMFTVPLASYKFKMNHITD